MKFANGYFDEILSDTRFLALTGSRSYRILFVTRKRLRRDPIGSSFSCFDGVEILSDTRSVVRDPIGYSLQRQPEDPTGYFVVVVDFVSEL